MTEQKKSKILNTHTISCRGVPSYRGQCMPTAVDALLTIRADGTVDVICPFYRGRDEGGYRTSREDGKGTCEVSERGNRDCIYRKLKPNTEE